RMGGHGFRAKIRARGRIRERAKIFALFIYNISSRQLARMGGHGVRARIRARARIFALFIYNISSRQLARTGGHPYGSPLLKQSENQRKKRRFSLFYFYKQ